MYKYNFFMTNIKKEEQWLEECRLKGYRLTKVKTLAGRYEFEKVNSNEFVPKVKIDFRMFDNRKQYEDYKALFEDSGWIHLAGSKSGGNQYFQQALPETTEDIFSDEISKADRYKRIAAMWFNMCAVYLPLFVALNIQGLFSFQKILHLKDLYYTPGLWEMTGTRFWRAFLFETPFAMGRAIPGFLLLLFLMLYICFGLKALYWHHKDKAIKL